MEYSFSSVRVSIGRGIGNLVLAGVECVSRRKKLMTAEEKMERMERLYFAKYGEKLGSGAGVYRGTDC